MIHFKFNIAFKKRRYLLARKVTGGYSIKDLSEKKNTMSIVKFTVAELQADIWLRLELSLAQFLFKIKKRAETDTKNLNNPNENYTRVLRTSITKTNLIANIVFEY